MKREPKNMSFDKVSSTPGEKSRDVYHFFSTHSQAKSGRRPYFFRPYFFRHILGDGGHAYREKDIFLGSLLIMVLLPAVAFASVAGEVNKANGLYRQGKFDESLSLYQNALGLDAASPVIKYNLGTALYKNGDYAKSMPYLEQAAQDKNLKIKPKAEYNLGNALYKSGIKKADTNADEAIKTLQEALKHYDKTLAVDPKDQDALYNKEFVKKVIEQLKLKKQQQQQNQNRQQQNKNQQQQSQQNQQKEQNQQNQQNQQKQQEQQNQQKQQNQGENQQSQQPKSEEQKQHQASAESQDQKQKDAGQQAQESQKDYDRREAENLLEDYRENEEPKKLLNYMPKKIDERPVLKDW